MAAKAGRLQIQLELEVAALRRDLAAVNAELKRNSADWKRSIDAFGQGFKDAFKFAGITAALAAVGAAIKGTLDEMSRITDESAKIHDSAENFQRLAYAAGQVGVEMEDVTKAVGKLQVQLGQIDSGGGKQAAAALKSIGLSMEDLRNLSPTEAFLKVGGAIGEVGDASQQAALGAALFGKGWQTLLPLITEGEDGMKAAAEQATVMSNATVAAGDDFGDAMDRMQGSLMALLGEGFAPLLPVLTLFANETSDASKEAVEGAGDMNAMREAMAGLGTVVNGVVLVFKAASQVLQLFGRTIGTVAAAVMEGIPEMARMLSDALDPSTWFDEKKRDSLIERFKGIGSGLADAMEQIRKDTIAGMTDVFEQTAKLQDKIEATRKAAPAAPPIVGRVGGEEAAAATAATKKAADQAKADAAQHKAAMDAAKERLDAEADLRKEMDAETAQMKELHDAEVDLAAARKIANGESEQSVEIWALQQKGASDYTIALVKLGQQTDEVKKKQDEQTKASEEAKRNAQAWGEFIGQGVADIFTSMTEGAEAAEKAILRLIAQMLAAIATKKILESFGIATQAKGGAWSQGYQVFAQGGIVASPTAFSFAGGRMGVMGEAGPEAIMPLKRDASGKLGVAGAANVQVFNYAGADIGVQKDEDRLRITVDKVRQTIASDIARGGNPVAAAFERAYSVRR